MTTFKTLFGPLTEMSLEETSVWSKSSNDSTLLSYPNIKPKATLGERAFVFAAPKLWNAPLETYQGIHFY